MGAIKGYTIEWCSQLKSDNGWCHFDKNKILLSKSRLQGQKRTVLVKTILHEAIHAYLDKIGISREENAEYGREYRIERKRISQAIGEYVDSERDIDRKLLGKIVHSFKCVKCGLCIDRSIAQTPYRENFPRMQQHMRDCTGTFEELS